MIKGVLSCIVATSMGLPLLGCGKRSAPDTTAADSPGAAQTSTPQADAKGGAADPLVKLSQYGGSLYCSVARSPDGTLHAIYTDRADATKLAYLYYRASRDGGATWGEAKNLSDDESGLSAYYCRAMVDGKGRAYAIWKYLTAASDSLDGPGSVGCGILAYRCLDGGAWSKTVRLTSKKDPSTSFFAATAPDGTVHLVWAQGNPEIDWESLGGVGQASANWIRQAALDGGAEPTPRDVIRPAPIPTKAEVDAAHVAGREIALYDQGPHQDGLWNLRGYVDASGTAHFVGDHWPDVPPGSLHGNGPTYLACWDGQRLTHVLDEKDGQAFNNPPTLLLDGRGREHLIRKPANTEAECVRDYPMVNGQPGDPADVIVPDKAPGAVADWQATALPGGRMAVTCALSQHGGWAPDDVELYLSTSDGDGKWTKPVNLTNNAARQQFMSKQNALGGVAKSSTYRPDFAESVDLGNGGLGVLMVNTEHAVLGITSNGLTASGRVAGSLATGSIDAPYVFFRRL